MYSNCIFCHANLGANEAIEHFPVGRRLAFDAQKGRLWVVCALCERWNLTPLEERWEAIDECERAFRATALRFSTDNIGLARLKEGIELVRVGRPLRPELAAWRYGDQFGRRRRRTLLRSGLALAAVGSVVVGGAVLGFSVVGASLILFQTAHWAKRGAPKKGTVAVIRDQYGTPMRITDAALAQVRLAWEERRRDWALEIPGFEQSLIFLRGTEALSAAALLLPATNRFGGSGATTRQAITLLEQHGNPAALFRDVAGQWDGTATGYRDLPGDQVEFVADSPRGFLTRLAPVQRLALEMAAHEDAERVALEGELRELETAWRNAEEIASIADDLLLPPVVRQSVAKNTESSRLPFQG